MAAPYPALTAEQRHKLARDARLALARRAAERGDVLRWGAALFPDTFVVPFCNEFHGYLVKTRLDQFGAVEAPRGHAKTTIACFLIPLYQALNEPEKFKHYLNVQATEEKALDLNRAIKLELEENEELIALYGDQQGLRWTDAQFVLRNGVVFSARSAGQSLRGIKYRSYRPDYIIVDDLYDENEVGNVAATKKVNAWFWGTLYPARSKVRKSSIRVYGTAANKADLLEHFKTSKRWCHRTFKAVKDWDKKTVLWPELNSFDDIMAEAEDMPTVIFNREMQNERRDDSESIIKDAWLKDIDDSELLIGKPGGPEVAANELGVDPSIGATPGSDFTGMVRVLVLRYPDAPAALRYHVTGAWNRRLSLNSRVALMNEIHAEDPISRAHVEGIAGFKDFVAEVKRRTPIPVREVSKVKDKLTNLENKSGYFENGRVTVSSRLDPKIRAKLREQLTNNNPTHDDMRDALLLVLPELVRKQSWRPIV